MYTFISKFEFVINSAFTDTRRNNSVQELFKATF